MSVAQGGRYKNLSKLISRTPKPAAATASRKKQTVQMQMKARGLGMKRGAY